MMNSNARTENLAGGMIRANLGQPQPLQYVANTAFLASLFVDYMNATGVPGWYCGTNYVSADVLRSFASSQVPSSSRSVLLFTQSDIYSRMSA